MKILQINDGLVQIGPARLEQLIDLRHAVLRQGLPRDEAIFDGDTAEGTRHYGALLAAEVIGCATFHPSQWEGESAFQLRGMATDPRFRRQGIGQALLELAEADLRDSSPVRMLWCNARVPALGFYQRMGWTVCSELFEIPTAGPHHRMFKRL